MTKILYIYYMYVMLCYVMLWYGMVWYGMAWHGMAWYGTVGYVCMYVCMYVRKSGDGGLINLPSTLGVLNMKGLAPWSGPTAK